MTVRWTVRTANDRGALRTENRVLFEAPKEETTHLSGFFRIYVNSWGKKLKQKCIAAVAFGGYIVAFELPQLNLYEIISSF